MRVTCSGPKRFEYDFNTKKWLEVEEQDGVKNTRRVNDDINSLLAKEIVIWCRYALLCCLLCSLVGCAIWRISRPTNLLFKERWTTKLTPLKR